MYWETKRQAWEAWARAADASAEAAELDAQAVMLDTLHDPERRDYLSRSSLRNAAIYRDNAANYRRMVDESLRGAASPSGVEG